MKLLLFLSDAIIPLLIFYIVGMGLLNHQNIYDQFIKGAAEGFKTVIGILPTLIGLMVAVGILRASGFLAFLAEQLSVFTDLIHFPSELLPLALVKMFSSSAANGLTIDIYKEYGADSYLGRAASLMMSATEKDITTMALWVRPAKIKKTRYTLAGALLATGVGIAASVWLAGKF